MTSAPRDGRDGAPPRPSRPPRTDAGRWLPTRWPLRWQLVGGILALMGLVVAGIGAVSVAALNASLVSRLDQQLFGFAFDAKRDIEQGQQLDPGALLTGPGRPIGTVGALVANGNATVGGVLDPDGAAELTAEQAVALVKVPTSQGPSTTDLGSLGDYRTIALDIASGPFAGGKIVLGVSLSSVQTTTSQLAGIVLGLALAGLVLAVLLGLLIVRLALRPLDRVAAVATEVADMPLDRGEVALSARVPDHDTDPHTEVGRVGSAFNRMLGHVGSAFAARHASEERLRRFVADASHELRTPLASIRGYSELTRRMVDRLPEDAAYALGRVEAESIRMTGLVEDLLLLARLDAKQELVRADVDLVPLVRDAVRDAEAAGADHTWTAHLPEGELVASVDRARVQQVIANLLGNARVHTPAGTAVDVRLDRSETDAGTVARLSVVDDGPGIDPALQPNLFVRFARGDASRSRHAGSTGLGLAIVDAVVRGHGGSVAVESRPGRTAFIVELPVAGGRDAAASAPAVAVGGETG